MKWIGRSKTNPVDAAGLAYRIVPPLGFLDSQEKPECFRSFLPALTIDRGGQAREMFVGTDPFRPRPTSIAEGGQARLGQMSRTDLLKLMARILYWRTYRLKSNIY